MNNRKGLNLTTILLPDSFYEDMRKRYGTGLPRAATAARHQDSSLIV
jgi:hypothetical protein